MEGNGGAHDDHAGGAAREQERVEAYRVEPCPLHGARERGQKDVRGLAGRVQTEAQLHAK